jgi:hypothetical protein
VPAVPALAAATAEGSKSRAVWGALLSLTTPEMSSTSPLPSSSRPLGCSPAFTNIWD